MNTKATSQSISSLEVIDLEKRKELILDHETKIAWELALSVIEKPKLSVWMILIPILFAFYFWKLKEYEQSLKSFSQNSLIPWDRVLDVVFVAEKNCLAINKEELIEKFVMKRETTRPMCGEWLAVLTRHFQVLLNSHGDSYQDLIRNAYKNRENYLQFLHQRNTTEAAFNMALLETIEGDSSELYRVTQKMIEGMKTIHLKSVAIYFPESKTIS